MENATTSLLVLKELAGHPPTHLDPLQQFLAQHIAMATSFWLAMWCVTALILLFRLWDEYKEQHDDEKR